MSGKVAKGSAQRAKPKSKSKTTGRGKAVRKGSAPMVESLPLPDAVRRVSWWILAGMVAALAIAVASALGVPQLFGRTMGEAIGDSGFTLKHVEIKGAVHVPQLEVYNIAFDQTSPALPLVDLEGTRQRLLGFGWVKDARVSRRFPDTLVVDIVERKPAAIWQNNQRLVLIDNEGVVLQPVQLEAMPDLPLVIGPAANRQVPGLSNLLDNAPHLKPIIAGATWIGGRRWDIRFQSGEVIMLPEGDAAAAKAIARFAQLDRETQLLGRGLVRFDMRNRGKLTVRVSSEPGSSVASMTPGEAHEPAAAPAAAAEPAPPAQHKAPAPAPVVPSTPIDTSKTI
jgi:cell division protein FtsQ